MDTWTVIADARSSSDRSERTLDVAGLSDLEREIILQRHGFDGGKRKTQKQIGRKLGLTRQRIGQIGKRALGRS